MKYLLIALLIVPVFCVSVSAQSRNADTLRVTLAQAEEQFLKNNLSLIAKHYDIDNAQAQVITARLFPNPDFSFSNGIYANDQTSGPAYNEHSFSLSQLFTTAGKRNKNIQLQKLGVQQSREQFFDLLRTLKFSLRTALYTVYYQAESAKVYDEEINALSKTLVAYKEQYAKGNIAQKELLRIQAQLYSLQTEFVGLKTAIDTTESQVRLLLHIGPDTYVKPVINGDITDKLSAVNYQKLLDSAYNNRADLRLAKVTVDYNNMNLSLQKATAVPDFSLSLNYDRLGGYGTDFLGAGIEFNLPFFNRNQGNIKSAKVVIDQSKIQLQSQQDQVTSDVATAYKVGLTQMNLYNSFDPTFKADFSHLINEVYINYEKRNISLLEFLDYYDTYKTNTLLINNLKMGLANSLEQLNYVTGTPFFN